jgi:arylsulfatase A-like enzyme
MNRSQLAMIGAAVLILAATAAWVITAPPPAVTGSAGEAEGAVAKPAAPRGAPNILFIVWDTTRADRLSLYGYDRETTPRLDAFAKGAVVFDRAISPAMWTPPSHSSMFTGYAPTHHGVEASNKWLDAHHVTLAEHLGAQGWDTYAFSANPYVAPSTNITQGFEQVDNTFSKPWKAEARKSTRAKLIKADASSDISPSWKPQPGQMASGMAHAFKDGAPVAHQALNAWLAERAEPERPWFAFINMMEAHIPRVPSMASRKAFLTDAQIDLGLKTDVAQINLLAHTFGKKTYTADEVAAINGVYDAAIRDMDDATGALLDDLRARGLLENTIVVLTADHGENLGDHGMFGHKYNVYDTLLHVPLVLSWEGHLPARRVSLPVSNLNLFATLLELAGVGLPAATPGNPAPDGRANLLELAAADPVFSELNEATPIAITRIAAQYGLTDPRPYLRTFRAVEWDGWKLIQASDDHRVAIAGQHELYRLPDDPDEAHNRYDAEPSVVAKLEALLDDWVRQVPVYDPAGKTAADDHRAIDRADGGNVTDQMLKELGYVDGAGSPEAAEPLLDGPKRKRRGDVDDDSPEPADE